MIRRILTMAVTLTMLRPLVVGEHGAPARSALSFTVLGKDPTDAAICRMRKWRVISGRVWMLAQEPRHEASTRAFEPGKPSPAAFFLFPAVEFWFVYEQYNARVFHQIESLVSKRSVGDALHPP
jgi:hypothetical protein